jgi:hypothetical protein
MTSRQHNNVDLLKGGVALVTSLLALIAILTTGALGIVHTSDLPAALADSITRWGQIACVILSLIVMALGLAPYAKSRSRSVWLAIGSLVLWAVAYFASERLTTNQVIALTPCAGGETQPFVMPFQRDINRVTVPSWSAVANRVDPAKSPDYIIANYSFNVIMDLRCDRATNTDPVAAHLTLAAENARNVLIWLHVAVILFFYAGAVLLVLSIVAIPPRQRLPRRRRQTAVPAAAQSAP